MAETKKKGKRTGKAAGAGVHKTRLNYNDPMLLLEIEGYARDGFDDKQIAEIMDVTPEAFNRNKQKKVNPTHDNPKGLSQLSLSLSRARRPLNVMIENSMFKRGMGMTVTTTTTVTKRIIIPGVNNEEPVEVEQTTVTKTELPPDFNSMNKWLTCRKPEVYNVQPERLDLTSGGKPIDSNPPKITSIAHIHMSDKDIKKQDVEV